MRILVRPLKHTLAALGILSLALVLLSGTSQKAHAAPQKHETPQGANCYAPKIANNDLVEDTGPQQGYITYSTHTETCGSDDQETWSQTLNCASQTYNINADAWQSQGTVPGSIRYNETGRSGYWAIPNTCGWYSMRDTGIYWFPPTPFYGCSWFHNYETGGGADYLCARSS